MALTGAELGIDPNDYDVLLLTGSRMWTYLPAIASALTLYIHHAFGRGRRLLVLHGDCNQGADALAKIWLARRTSLGWPVAQHAFPADWTGPCVADRCPGDHRRRRRRDGAWFCPDAGRYRNEQMVAAGPQWCEGFNRNHSPGTSGCLRLARQAQIATHETSWDIRHRVRYRLAQPLAAVA